MIVVCEILAIFAPAYPYGRATYFEAIAAEITTSKHYWLSSTQWQLCEIQRGAFAVCVLVCGEPRLHGIAPRLLLCWCGVLLVQR